jgi:glycosyltransferase involved in cell wall biosynthesis
MTFGLVLLTFNEIDGLRDLFTKIPFQGFDEFFVVDGGSVDGSLEFFADHGVKVFGQTEKGRGGAFRVAFNMSNSDVLIFFSPDGNEAPEDITKVRDEFLKNPDFDLVIASRMMEGAVNEEDEQIFRWRKWANNVFNLFANLFFNKSLFHNYVTDSINGFRGFKRTAFNSLELDALGYTIEYQSTIRAFRHRLKIKEIPTIEGARVGGESYAKSIPTGLAFVRCFMRELFLFK